MPKVIIPPPYRGPTQGEAEIEVEAESVRASLNAIEATYPGFAAQIFDASGGVHRFVKLFRNGDPVGVEDLDKPIAAGDEIEVVAAIAGG